MRRSCVWVTKNAPAECRGACVKSGAGRTRLSSARSSRRAADDACVAVCRLRAGRRRLDCRSLVPVDPAALGVEAPAARPNAAASRQRLPAAFADRHDVRAGLRERHAQQRAEAAAGLDLRAGPALVVGRQVVRVDVVLVGGSGPR